MLLQGNINAFYIPLIINRLHKEARNSGNRTKQTWAIMLHQQSQASRESLFILTADASETRYKKVCRIIVGRFYYFPPSCMLIMQV